MSPTDAPESEFAGIIRRLDELQSAESAPPQVMDYYRALAGLFHDALPLTAPAAGPLQQRQAHLDAGETLLSLSSLVFDPQPTEAFFHQVAQTIAAYQPGAEEALAALDAHRLDLPTLMEGIAANAPLDLEKVGDSAGVAPLTLQVLLEYSLRPTLRAWAACLLTGIDLGSWQRPACPVCGTLPLLAEWDPATRRRSLRCAICGAAWSYPLEKCPACSSTDPASHGMLSFDDDPRYFAQTCRVCHTCVKTVVTHHPIPHDLLSLEDLLSIDLDQGCRERGYRRFAGAI